MTMDLLRVAAASVGSIIALFVLTKLLGYKQMSQLSMFDYINGISIGSIAAEMATTVDGSFMKPLLAMTIYAVLVYFIDLLAVKSLKFRRFFGGRSLVLFENGKLYKENLRKAKIDVSEFLTECRLLGYFDINDISMAMMENNGKISVLPTTGARPVNVEDMDKNMQGVNPKKPSRASINVILDGIILYDNLKYTGNNDIWLKIELGKQGISDVKKVFLATVDENNKLSVFKELSESPDNDLFQ